MMKFIPASLIILIFLFSNLHLNAQIIKGEAIAGLNLTQVDGDEIYGFHKIRANLGAGVMIPFGKKGKWDVSLETLFNQKGSYQRPQYDDSTSNGEPLTGEYKLHLNYLEVPVLIMFTDKEIITIGAGLSWGRLVGVKEYEHGRKVETTTVGNGPYSKNDFSILGDIRFRIWDALKINLRYQYSMVKIRTREFPSNVPNGEPVIRDQYNNVITIRLIYMFNEKRSRENFQDAQ